MSAFLPEGDGCGRFCVVPARCCPDTFIICELFSFELMFVTDGFSDRR